MWNAEKKERGGLEYVAVLCMRGLCEGLFLVTGTWAVQVMMYVQALPFDRH